jgi:HEPN domain-containing protein
MGREKDWLQYSEELLEIADLLMKNDKHSWACFTLQQSSAAALKSIMAKYDELTFGDNLIKLIRIIGQNTKIPPEVKNSCHKLNEYFNVARDLENKSNGTPLSYFTHNDVQDARSNTLVIIRFAHHLLH